MANLKKKVIREWNRGILSSNRSNNPDTSIGASMIKHFDIYSNKNKLIPISSWSDFTTTAEKDLGIVAVGGLTNDIIYGLGKGLTNWYSVSWNYRIHITTALFTGSVPVVVKLSSMPSDFWSHVKNDGSDIRVIDSNGATEISFELEEFNFAGHTGEIWVASSDFYIYYGNANATALLDIPTALGTPFLTQASKVWQGYGYAFSFPGDSKNNVNYTQKFTTEPNYTSGIFGKAIDGNIETNVSDNVFVTGSNVSMSFLIYPTSNPAVRTNIIKDVNNTFYVDISATGKVITRIANTLSQPESTTVASLVLNQWNKVDIAFDNSTEIWINNNKETFTYSGGTYITYVDQKLMINTNSFCKLAQVYGYNNRLSDTQVATQYNNFLNNASFWTIGSEVNISAITLTYGGFAIYIKSLLSGNWSEYTVSGHVSKNITLNPVNAFVERVNNDIYFLVSQNPNNGGFIYLAKTDSSLIIETVGAITTINANKILPTFDVPVDNSFYFSDTDNNLCEITNPVSIGVYVAGINIESLVAWRNYLAVGGTRRSRGQIEIWDLNQANPIERADAGTGNLRIVGNASDTLFCVVDNYIDDVILSSNQPSMEIKQYIGNGQMETTHKIQIPAVYTGWADYWERAISNFKFRHNTETLFYAKLPSNALATEFNEGFFSIGKNQDGLLALALMLDTSTIGDTPMSVYGYAKQVFFVEKDGGIKKLDTDGNYNNVSLFTTLKMNEGNTEIEKDLIGIELITEPLTENQVVTVYAKTNFDTDRIKIMEMSGENEISKEMTTYFDETALPHYKEIEFDIESTGGNSAVLELNYKYEYLSDLI